MAFSPRKADAVLVVNADTPLTNPVAPELLQAIPWERTEVIYDHGLIQHAKFTPCDTLYG